MRYCEIPFFNGMTQERQFYGFGEDVIFQNFDYNEIKMSEDIYVEANGYV
ncbi:MAG: hypothetical protein ACTSXV_01510 [Alphaproteobacteria bacterium]